MWADLHEGILEEFTSASRFSVEDTFASMSDFVAKRTAQRIKEARAHRARGRSDPVWVEKERVRHKESRERHKRMAAVRDRRNEMRRARRRRLDAAASSELREKEAARIRAYRAKKKGTAKCT